MRRSQARANASDLIQFLGRGYHVQLTGERRNLLDRKRSQKRLQQDLRFAQAGIEIVVMALKTLPGVMGMNGSCSRQFVGLRMELDDKTLQRFGKYSELLEKSR